MTEVDVMQLRNELVDAGKRLDARRLVAGSEGNLSAKLPDGTVLITTSGRMLGRLHLTDFVVVDVASGAVMQGSGRPTSELMAHLEAYRAEESIGAIVHAHPSSVVAMTLRGWSLEGVPLPEVAYALGSVPTCEFAVPGTDEGGRVTRRWAATREAVLFDRHGAMTLGRTLDQALGRMEMLDAVANTILLAGGPDNLTPLTDDQVARVAEAAKRAGVREEALRAWVEKVRS